MMEVSVKLIVDGISDEKWQILSNSIIYEL